MNLQAPDNNLFVKVKTKTAKHFSRLMAVASANNLPVNPADCVSIQGEIVSLPKTISNDHWHKGFSLKDIKVGDTAIFSHQVIYDLDETYNDIPVYKNLLFYGTEEYFACDIVHVFAVIRDGEIIMVNGWVMLTEFYDSKIVLPSYMKHLKKTVKSEIMHIGNPKNEHKRIDAKQGDTVCYNPLTAQKYEINKKPFVILPQEKILGRNG